MDANLINKIAAEALKKLRVYAGPTADHPYNLEAIKSAIEKAMQAWLTSGNPNDYASRAPAADAEPYPCRCGCSGYVPPRPDAAATQGHEWTVKALDDDGKGFGFAVVDETGKEIMRSLSRFECDRTAAAALRLAAATTSGAVSNEFLDQARAAATQGQVGIQPRICIDGHDYMLVSEHYAAITAERERYESLERSVMDLSHPNCKMLLADKQDTERDAARYQFLKWERNWSKLEPLVRYAAINWDEAIDYAMSQARQKKEKE